MTQRYVLQLPLWGKCVQHGRCLLMTSVLATFFLLERQPWLEDEGREDTRESEGESGSGGDVEVK